MIEDVSQPHILFYSILYSVSTIIVICVIIFKEFESRKVQILPFPVFRFLYLDLDQIFQVSLLNKYLLFSDNFILLLPIFTHLHIKLLIHVIPYSGEAMFITFVLKKGNYFK